MQKSLRTHRRGTGWRCIQGVLFREHQGWFFESWMHVPPKGSIGWQFNAKPMAIDPILWRLVGHEEWNEQPLSWRILGSVCAPLVVTKIFPEVSTDPDVEAIRLIEWSNQQLEAFMRNATLQEFVALLEKIEKPPRGHAITRIATYILMGDEMTALKLSADAAAKGENGGMRFYGHGGPKTFFEGAVSWLKTRNTLLH
ncbi:hypothetical protein [Roseibium salinum]|uniref:DUF4304 domain-containing protein n=2 Tax=Roseibium salinum TaxID=1604349 RepID=A0ABT3R949_9HYPH|nr:hypothetical protein [Roseibium sp. DSM 29163]MCX2725847.1 hypothetical protein [Roseibium sp. DSM 29163]